MALTDFQILQHGPGQEDAPWPFEAQLYFARQVEADAQKEAERLFWEACKPHGKVGEVVFMTYKAKRGAAPRPVGHDITGDRNVDHPV